MATALATPLSQLHRFSLEEYHRLIECGGFDEDARVELIEGAISDMSPKTPAHENAIAWLARWLMLAVDSEPFEVRVCAPLTLAGSEPEPDLSVVALNTPRPYHPATAALTIEVAASSQDRDLRQKPLLYAQAQVSEYWVVDLDARRAVVHRDPQGGAYRTVCEITATGSLQASALDLPELAADELFAAAAR